MSSNISWLAVILLLAIGPSSCIRLPDSTYPLHYDLNLSIDVESSSYSGSVIIQLNVTSANTRLIALNYHEIEVENVLIYRASDITNRNLLNGSRTIPNSQIIEFLTAEDLIQFEEYVLKLDFSGAIRSDLKGLYMSSYFINGTRRNLATTFFAPHYARMVFPCYDEPHFKATFDVQITHHSQYHALGNGKTISRLQNLTDTTKATTSFQRTPRMSTYLVAFIVSDLVATTTSSDNSIAVWAQPSKTSSTALSLKYAPQVRNVLEDYLGLPYQMNKLDLVAVDDFLMGAMENYGLITFASGRLLADESTTMEQEQGVTKIVAHEIVHQWFGNLVTCHWWTDIWLNEGFATYLEDVIADKVANQWLVLDQFVINEKIPAMRKDSDRANRKAMNRPVTTLEEISGIYDFVAYPKAASVLRMFHHVVGENIFQQTLRDYLKAHQFGNVERSDFFVLLQATARQLNWKNPQGIVLGEAFENWSANYGFPLVTVIRDSKSLRIGQSRFINSHFNSHTPAVDFFVPLQFAYFDNKTVDEWLGVKWLTPKEPSLTVELANKDSLAVVNPNAFGYFRVNYDEETWKQLSVKLHTTNNFSISSRVQLIDDVMTLARFGNVSYATALDLIEYVKTEKDYTPVAIALRQLEDLARNIRGLDEVNIQGMFERLLSLQYQDLNSIATARNVDSLLAVEVRNFACQFGYDKCIEESHEMFNTYAWNRTINADLRRSMFCGSMQSEDRFAEIQNIWRQLARTEAERSQNERYLIDILDSFSCIRNVTLLEELLKISVSSETVPFMTTGDRNRIFSAVVSGSVMGTELGLNFLQNNWRLAVERYGGAAQLYSVLAPNVVTAPLVTLFNTLVFNNMRKVVEPLTYEAAMAAVRQVEENVQFIANNREQLTEWFTKNYPGSGAVSGSLFKSLLLIVVGVLSLNLAVY